MDHYNEQLVRKTPDKKDIALRAVIIAFTVIISLFCIACAVYFMTLPLVLIMAAAVYLGYTLLLGTVHEYEYIVTNNDFDIDKIIGKRRRKRLITVNIKNVEAIGEYTGKENINVSATVMAHDNNGINTWYLVAKHDNHGKVMVLFTPDKRTLEAMNASLPYALRLKLPEADEANSADE